MGAMLLVFMDITNSISPVAAAAQQTVVSMSSVLNQYAKDHSSVACVINQHACMTSPTKMLSVTAQKVASAKQHAKIDRQQHMSHSAC